MKEKWRLEEVLKSLRSFLVVTLSILMCLNILQTEVFSLEEDKQENYVMNKYEESKEINEEEIEYEIEERRTSHTRFFKMKRITVY